MRFRVVEIFQSIEGEGSLIGFPVLFIRLEGCNLRCPWCDTTYSYDGKSYKDYPLDELLNIVKNSNFKRVCLTGGEPLLTPNVEILIEKILSIKDFLIIETNGTVFNKRLKATFEKFKNKIYTVVSPKPEVNYKIHQDIFPFISEIKFVVDEFLTINDILKYSNLYKNLFLILQPESNKEIYLKKALQLQNELLTSHNLEARLIPQCHKLLNLK